MRLSVIKLFILVYLLVFPFGQLARLPIEVFGPEVRVYLGDVLVGLAVLVWGMERVKKIEKGRGGWPVLTGPILTFAGVAGLSLLVNLPRLAANEVAVSFFYLLRWVVYAGLYFVFWDTRKIQRFKDSKIQSNQNSKILNSHPEPRASLGFGAGFSPLNLLMLAGGLAATFGLLQYFWFPDLRIWLESQNWDPHYYRAYGTFFDPGFLGIIMVLSLILVAIRLFEIFSRANPQIPNSKSKTMKQNKVRFMAMSRARLWFRAQNKYYIPHTIYCLLLLICYLALALTYSRASYLAFLIGMGVIAWRLKKPKFFAGVLGVFLLTILLLPRPGGEGVRLERESTIEARIRNWRQSLTVTKDHFLFGVGFNSYRYSQRDYGFLAEDAWQETHAGAGADSSLLFVLATTGIIGLGIYIRLIGAIGQIGKQNTVILASLAAVLAHSFFLNSLFYPWVMGWMFLLVGSNEPKLSGKIDCILEK